MRSGEIPLSITSTTLGIVARILAAISSRRSSALVQHTAQTTFAYFLASSWTKASSAARALSQPRHFFTVAYLPSASQKNTGFRLSMLPRRYVASLMRPPWRRYMRSFTVKYTRVSAETSSSLPLRCSNGTPSSTMRTAAMTTMPAATPMLFVSTTSTGKFSM